MFIPPVDPDFHFILNSNSLKAFKKHLLHWSVSGDAVLQLLYVWESILSCFWYVFFLGIEFWVKYISLSILRCGASALWLTLSHLPNLLSFPFLFYCVCFSFWLHFFGWLFETVNYHAPLNSCPISCPCINWTSVLMGLKLSSYLENFQPVIRTFFSVFSFFHFLWDSIYIYFSIPKVVSNLCDAQLIVSHSLFIPIFHVSI